MAKKKTRKKTRKRASTGGSLFKIAARDKSYKRAKSATTKAESRKKAAWRKALVKAKKVLRRKRHC